MRTTILPLLLAATSQASELSQDAANPDAVTGYHVDTSANKFIGRISAQLDFNPWVKNQVVSSNHDEHLCEVQYQQGDPFATSVHVTRTAQHLAHNCSSTYIQKITLRTQVPSIDMTRQTVDTNVIPLLVDGSATIFKSVLTQPKT